MTVAGYDETGKIMCQWFDGSDLKEGSFNPEVLKKAESPAGFDKKIGYGASGVA
jgi:uncharacterized protein YodC (DUF2158 family)